MLPIILNIQDKPENVDFINSIAYTKKTHIYIPLISREVINRATEWLVSFPFMQNVCEIIDYNSTKMMHLKPLMQNGNRCQATGVYTRSGFGIELDKPEFSVALTRDGLDVGWALAEILDSAFLENESKDIVKTSGAFQYLHNFSKYNFCFIHTGDILELNFNPASFKIHITDDLHKLFDDALALEAPTQNLLIPVDDDATSAEASTSATSSHDDALSAALKRIAELETLLRKCHIIEKAQAATISHQADMIKALTDTHFGEMDAAGVVDDHHVGDLW